MKKFSIHALILTTLSLGLHLSAVSQNLGLDWAKSFGSQNIEFGEAIAIDASGDVIVAGYFNDSIDFDPGPNVLPFISKGYEDIFIIKLNASGNLIWARQIGGTDRDELYSIALDPSGNILATGTFQGDCDFDPGNGTAVLSATSTVGDQDIFILKLDANGDYLWAYDFGEAASDIGTYITCDAQSNIYTTGIFGDSADFNPQPGLHKVGTVGLDDIFILKLEADGDFVFVRSIGGSDNDYVRSIAVDNSQSIYITGNFRSTVDFDPGIDVSNLSSSGDHDAFVMKLDSAGAFEWAKKVGGNDGDFMESVVPDNLGHLYLTGYFKNTVDLNPGTGTAAVSSNGNFDFFVSKLDTGGNFIWGHHFGSLYTDFAFDLFYEPSQARILVTGRFLDEIDFNPGSGVDVLESNGSDDAFVLSLDSAGTFNWVKQFGGSQSDMGRAVAANAGGDVYTTGIFRGNCDFDPGSAEFELEVQGGSDAFVAKLSPSGVGLSEKSKTPDVQVSPVPFGDLLTLKLSQTQTLARVSLMDMTGRVLMEQTYFNISLITLQPDVADGCYLLQVSNGEHVSVRKVVKQ